ncbi:MAG TPA: hypothetical protein VL242_29675 [Sorangium sp.]|uniref:hypothetical protein n=1 Tax=Sorangium sp. So ce1153 TaxID=3133333 RepID=UPI002C8812A0|nr:hypothetical protein [Sorangium sp.]
MKKRSSIFCVLMPLLLAACDVTIIDGGSNDGGATDPVEPSGEGGSAGHAGCGGSGGGADPGEPLTAVALTRAQLDVLWDEYWASQGDVGTSGSTGGGDVELDPNDLFLRASDLGASCGSPTTHLTCGGHWQLSIALPIAYQRVGVYDLEDPELIRYSMMSETGEPYSSLPDDCPSGGGSIGRGTLEILAIDEAEVRYRVTLSSFWDTDPSGEYTAPRCP